MSHEPQPPQNPSQPPPPGITPYPYRYQDARPLPPRDATYQRRLEPPPGFYDPAQQHLGRQQWEAQQFAQQQGWIVQPPAAYPTYARTTINHTPHIILDIVTLGLWIPVHITLAILGGRKTKFR